MVSTRRHIRKRNNSHSHYYENLLSHECKSCPQRRNQQENSSVKIRNVGILKYLIQSIKRANSQTAVCITRTHSQMVYDRCGQTHGIRKPQFRRQLRQKPFFHKRINISSLLVTLFIYLFFIKVHQVNFSLLVRRSQNILKRRSLSFLCTQNYLHVVI